MGGKIRSSHRLPCRYWVVRPVFHGNDFMDVTSLAAASANSAEQSRIAVGMAVLKKAIDIEAAGALALVQAIPEMPQLPTGAAGGIVNTWA
jgi:hypothetical protein